MYRNRHHISHQHAELWKINESDDMGGDMKRSHPTHATMTSHKPTTATNSDGSTDATVSAAVSLSPLRLIDPSSSPLSTSARVRQRVKDVSPPPFYDSVSGEMNNSEESHNDGLNYALLIALYTLQGIPMGLSASIPFLIQQKIRTLAQNTAQHLAENALSSVSSIAVAGSSSLSSRLAQEAAAARLSYNANAIFALCSWPFSLKLLWAPIVDACFIRSLGRRKSWIVPVQSLAGMLMVLGANFVERQLGLGLGHTLDETINVKGVTAFFFVLYVLMATQDIAVDGWALTMLSKKNRGRGPICNSIGQNIGYFLSFVGFLALNDAESSEALWRPLLRIPSNPEQGLVSLGTFIRTMGYLMLVITTAIALFKKETPVSQARYESRLAATKKVDFDDDKELDAAEIGLKETYHRLWAVCKLPSVQWLFLILLTYRLPTSLSDNVKFLKAVEYGLSKSTTALLSPTVILPLGILVPIVAARIWHNAPLQQFMAAYRFRVTLVPILDVLMLFALQRGKPSTPSGLLSFWTIIVLSTACQATVNSMQFNAQMTFFAKRVDPAIGGSYMTLLNTAANLGGTWPASFVMWLVGFLSKGPTCQTDKFSGEETCTGGRDPFFLLQFVFSLLGCLWIVVLGKRVRLVSELPDDAWRTHLVNTTDDETLLSSNDVDLKSNKKTSSARQR